MLVYLDDFRKARTARNAVQDSRRKELQHCNVDGLASTCEIIYIQRPAMHSLHLSEDFTSIDLDNEVIDRLYALVSQF
jgi:hypothetical protein